ncbi:MAG: hypothetical protein U0Z44_03535 [Kouleothrix sp.]
MLITGWGRPVGDDKLHAAADFLIEKPFDQDDLRDILAQALG